MSHFIHKHDCTQIAKFIGPTWGPPGPHVGPMNLAIRLASLDQSMITTFDCQCGKSWCQKTTQQQNNSFLFHSLFVVLFGNWNGGDHTMNFYQQKVLKIHPKQGQSLASPTLWWCHNWSNSISYHQPHHCLLNRLFRRRSKKTSKLRVTGLCVGNSPGTGEFPAQMASNVESVSIWWHHHECFNALTM